MSDECLVLQVGSSMSGLVDCAVKIKARTWDQDQLATLAVDSLVLSASRLCDLRSRIESWLASNQVGIVAFYGEYSLAADGSSRLDLNFGTRTDTLAPGDKSVVTVVFKIGRFNGEFSFVTDQSCLRLFADDVVRAISDD